MSAATPATQPSYHGAIDAAHQTRAAKLLSQGMAYLMAHRDADGGWSLGQQGQHRAAATAMVLKALLQDPTHDVASDEVRKALEVLLSYRQDDGGFYDPQQGMAGYTTSLAAMALAPISKADASLTPVLGDAVAFLRARQIVPGGESADGQPIGQDHPFVGGVGYGKHGRPDLSNLGMWMQAMHDAGVSAEDPAMQRALAFVVRTQNRSESNVSVWAAAGPNDGGFIYAPAVAGDLAQGESKAGAAGGGLRSYGSMTYVGFKSLLYADLAHNDPRVRAALAWIRRYWRLDSNPNMPAIQSLQGLYYYYLVFAKALRAFGEPVITDRDGVEHNWREELIDALAERAGEDGSWVNPADRWFEGDPVLVTAYAVLALQEATRP